MTTWRLVLGVFRGFVASVGCQLKMVARSKVKCVVNNKMDFFL